MKIMNLANQKLSNSFKKAGPLILRFNVWIARMRLTQEITEIPESVVFMKEVLSCMVFSFDLSKQGDDHEFPMLNTFTIKLNQPAQINH